MPITDTGVSTEIPAKAPSGITVPDEYSLTSIDLITTKQTVSLKSMMVELSYFEDITRGTITGMILISDSISMIDRLGMNGSEFIHLKFKKGQQSAYEIDKYFRVFRVGERVIQNNLSENYTLHFCSEELFLSEQMKISKSYSGVEISTIVYNILTDLMQITDGSQRKVLVGKTKGLYDFVLGYRKPFELINWLANYALPLKGEGADYVFFENSEGFNFVSLQNLFSRETYARYKYTPRNVGNDGASKELGIGLIGIKSYNILDTFDSLYGTTMGVFANKVLTIDPLSRTYNTTTFDYMNYFKKGIALNEGSVLGNIQNRLGKKANESYDSVFKVLTTNSNHKQLPLVVNKSVQHGVANDIRAEVWVPNRTAQMALLNYSRVRILLSGDPNLTVGTKIEVILPSQRGPDGSGNNAGEKDEYHSGTYIITSVRHTIGVNNKYETILEVAKDSFGAASSTYDDNSISKVINR
jgi:hypothetical protein